MGPGRKSLVTLTTLFAFVGFAGACFADDASETPACKQATAAIAKQTGAKLDHIAPTSDNLYIKAPDKISITLYCSVYIDPFAALTQVGAKVTPSYYAAVAKTVAILFRGDASGFSGAAMRCRTTALKAADGKASINTSGATLECQASVGEDGSTSITVRSRDVD